MKGGRRKEGTKGEVEKKREVDEEERKGGKGGGGGMERQGEKTR